MKILSLLISTLLIFSPLQGAKKAAKLVKGSYHQLCKDLDNKVIKTGKSLSRAETKTIKKYLNAKTVSRLKKSDLKHFENAIKKHRFIEVDRKTSLKTNLKKWPEKNSVGKWYKLIGSSKNGSKHETNSSSGNENSTDETMDQDHGQTN